jgi:hypothetical protein
MNENTMVIAIVGIIVSGLVTSIALLARAWHSRRQPLPPIPHERLESIEMRLVELQQAVDDVVLEMERVAEGQRFTAKLLAERGQSDGPSEHSVAPR